jgi:hypothetical protein
MRVCAQRSPLSKCASLQVDADHVAEFLSVGMGLDPPVARQRLVDGVCHLGGFRQVGVHVHLMQAIGWVMIALFLWLFHGPWLAYKRAVDAGDWPTAGANLNRIRQIIAVNLPLGLAVVIIGASGRYWV